MSEELTPQMRQLAEDLAAAYPLTTDEAVEILRPAFEQAERDLALMERWLAEDLPGIIASVKAKYGGTVRP